MRPTLASLLLFGLLMTLAPARPLFSAEPARWLNGPVVGYFIEEGSLDVRAILGVPGSAVASSPLPLPGGAARVRLAPGQRYALVEFADAAPPAVMDLASTGAPIAITGAMPRADLCAFSPTGRAAALYSAADGRLQIVAGFPGEPRMTRELFLTAVDRIAAGDDGESLLYSGASGDVFLVLADSQPAPVIQASRLAGLSFLPNRREAALLDGARGELHLLEAGSTRLLASGLNGATALASSSNGSSVTVTAAELSRLWRIDVATGRTRALDLPASPVSLDALRLPDVFLISSRAGEPAWILDAGATEARAYFVPAVERELQ